MTKPERKTFINFTPLYEACKEYVDFLNSDKAHGDSEHPHFIFETVMSCIYGEDFWEWHNSKFM